MKGRGPGRPVADDIAVPPEILPDFLLQVQNVLKRQQITASLLAHAGHGELYIRPFSTWPMPATFSACAALPKNSTAK